MSKKKIIFYSGSRADYGLLEPIIENLKNRAELFLIIGPHHFEKSLGSSKRYIKKNFFKKIYNCKSKVNYKSVDINKFIYSSLPNYKKIIEKINPNLVVLLGDRYEVLSFAIASFFQNVKICHLHGGEKTKGSIDDTIRHVITKLSHYHFTTNNIYKKRVLSLGENKKNIFNFGSIGAEVAKEIKFISKKKIFLKLGIPLKKEIILTTFHPETNSVKPYKFQIKTFLSALKQFKEYHFVFTSSNGDPGGNLFNSEIKKFVKFNVSSNFFKNLGTRNYLNIMKYSKMILGNSSSAIIEAPSFNVPVLNVGSRQQGRLISKNILSCKLSKTSIQKSINEIIKAKKLKKKNFNLNYRKKSILKTSHKIFQLSKKNKGFKYFHDN